MKPVIDFYFDVVSPYTYIATQQLPALAERYRAEVRWHPVLVGGLFKLIGNTAPLTLPARAKNNYKDMQRLMSLLVNHQEPFWVNFQQPGFGMLPLLARFCLGW